MADRHTEQRAKKEKYDFDQAAPFWPTDRVLGHISMYHRETAPGHFGDPRDDLVLALQDGTLKAIGKRGGSVRPILWAQLLPETLPTDLRFKRRDVLKAWPRSNIPGIKNSAAKRLNKNTAREFVAKYKADNSHHSQSGAIAAAKKAGYAGARPLIIKAYGPVRRGRPTA